MAASGPTLRNGSVREEQPYADNAMDGIAPVSSSMLLPSPSSADDSFRAKFGLAGVARRTLGICLLLVTVFLWTASNFLASFIFSDHTYDKPFFLLYINASVFSISLLPRFARYLLKNGFAGMSHDVRQLWHEYRSGALAHKTIRVGSDHDEDMAAGERLIADEEGTLEAIPHVEEKLGFRETAVLSLDFCILWFVANYLASACLEYTSVASVTILTSTSSVWTLVLCAFFGVEPFSLRKLMGVAASLAGVALTSTVDLSGQSDENRGSFPHKTPGQIAVGDLMAFVSAVFYGVYVTVMKRRVGNEDRVDMMLFFGLVGVWNLVLLWPLFFILHWTGIETFSWPPSHNVWAIIIINSLSSYLSDITWAIAMLLTTPLVVTVGLSLTIPLSLIGEMIQYGRYSSFLYWVGAVIVFLSFMFINHESHEKSENKGGESHEGPGVSGLSDAAGVV